MRLLRTSIDISELPAIDDAVVVLALDGWTDAGSGGSLAGELLLELGEVTHLGEFDADALFDYRDRRPLLEIHDGQLGTPQWPELAVDLVRASDGPPLVVVHGGEPDLSWRALCADLVELGSDLGVRRYVGLGSVPGPIPHTRPVRMLATASDDRVLEGVGRPHERMIVPASFQVVAETAMRDAGAETLGLWVRIPHYVAGDYPEATRALLDRLARYLPATIDTSELDEPIEVNRDKLDGAAASSPEITEHIHQLEESYDQAAEDDPAAFSGPLPTGDEIAAELERFLRQQ